MRRQFRQTRNRRNQRCNSNGYRSNHRGTRELPQPGIWHQVLAAHGRPQAHCAALSAVHHFLLFHRRIFCPVDPAGAADSGRRPGAGRHLQQALHHARSGDGVLFPDPIDPRRAGQFPGAADDRRQGPGLPAYQFAELVSLHHRWHPDAALHAYWRRRYRMDFLYTFQHRLQQYEGH